MPGYKPSFGGDTPRRRNLTIDVQRKPVSISAETMADIEQIRAVYRASTTENTGSRCALRRCPPGLRAQAPPLRPALALLWPCRPAVCTCRPVAVDPGRCLPRPAGPRRIAPYGSDLSCRPARRTSLP